MDKVLPNLSKNSIYSTGNDIISNLPLQMALYFNVILSPVWCIIILIMLIDKFDCFSAIYQVVTVTATTIVIILECVRLFLGYSGNLENKMPDLAGFWMLSILIQLPLQCFLSFNPHLHLTITEIILQNIMLLLLVTQLISGYMALRTAAHHQILQYQRQRINVNK